MKKFRRGVPGASCMVSPGSAGEPRAGRVQHGRGPGCASGPADHQGRPDALLLVLAHRRATGGAFEQPLGAKPRPGPRSCGRRGSHPGPHHICSSGNPWWLGPRLGSSPCHSISYRPSTQFTSHSKQAFAQGEDAIVSSSFGITRPTYEGVSRFALNLASCECYSISWFSDGSSWISRKSFSSRQVARTTALYCSPSPEGTLPTQFGAVGIWKRHCLDCVVLPQARKCSSLCREGFPINLNGWASFLELVSGYGNQRVAATKSIQLLDGSRWKSAETESFIEGGYCSPAARAAAFAMRQRLVTSCVPSTVPWRMPGLQPIMARPQTTGKSIRSCIAPQKGHIVSSRGLAQGTALDAPSCRGDNNLPGSPLEPATRRHRRLHSCARCGKTFSRRSHLTTHETSVHDGLRPFQCTQCDLSFVTESNRRRHIKAVHEKLRRFVCNDCGFGFNRKADLVRHRRVLHGADGRHPEPRESLTSTEVGTVSGCP